MGLTLQQAEVKYRDTHPTFVQDMWDVIEKNPQAASDPDVAMAVFSSIDASHAGLSIKATRELYYAVITEYTKQQNAGKIARSGQGPTPHAAKIKTPRKGKGPEMPEFVKPPKYLDVPQADGTVVKVKYWELAAVDPGADEQTTAKLIEAQNWIDAYVKKGSLIAVERTGEYEGAGTIYIRPRDEAAYYGRLNPQEPHKGSVDTTQTVTPQEPKTEKKEPEATVEIVEAGEQPSPEEEAYLNNTILPLIEDEISPVLREHYNGLLVTDPKLKYDVVITLSVDADGKIKSAEAEVTIIDTNAAETHVRKSYVRTVKMELNSWRSGHTKKLSPPPGGKPYKTQFTIQART